MTDDVQMVALLRTVLDSEPEGVDNAAIAGALGWTLETVAAYLAEAKDRSLIWGQRNGDKPAPWFTELEVTVQGKRLVRSSPSEARPTL